MKEYIVTFKTSSQISHDEWVVLNPSMKVDENTTLKDIDNFYRKHHKDGFLQVVVIELSK